MYLCLFDQLMSWLSRAARWNLPQATLAKHIAVITREDDDGVVSQVAILKRLQKLANTVINIAARAVVCPLGLLDLLIREVLIPQVADPQQPLAVGVQLLLGYPDLWQVDVDSLIPFPVLLLNGVGVMWVGERNLRDKAALLAKRWA